MPAFDFYNFFEYSALLRMVLSAAVGVFTCVLFIFVVIIILAVKGRDKEVNGDSWKASSTATGAGTLVLTGSDAARAYTIGTGATRAPYA